MLRIRLYGDPALRKKSVPLKEVTDEKRQLIEEMITAMNESKGIGLAAPQVGVNERIFVVDVGEGPMVFINPRVLKEKGSLSVEEGCLSIPEVIVKVKRPEEIFIQYKDENNKTVERACGDLLARVVLHEIDHLNGKLIVDYATFREKLKLRKKLNAIKKRAKNHLD